MTFTTVVFGTINITALDISSYIDGSSIPTSGYMLYVVPKTNIGSNPIDIRVTYINQFGQTKTTSLPTNISAGTTLGTHIKITLEPGDSGIRDIVAINSFIGGTAGEQLSLESWNEGTGAPPIDILNTYSLDRSQPGTYTELITPDISSRPPIDVIDSSPIGYTELISPTPFVTKFIDLAKSTPIGYTELISPISFVTKFIDLTKSTPIAYTEPMSPIATISTPINLALIQNKLTLVGFSYLAAPVATESIPTTIIGLPTKVGSLNITSTPLGTEIYTDGIDREVRTPYLLLNINVGIRTIKLTLKGYQDWIGVAIVLENQTTNVDATLIPLPCMLPTCNLIVT